MAKLKSELMVENSMLMDVNRQLASDIGALKEDIGVLSMQIEDIGWQKIQADAETELSRSAIRTIVDQVTIMYLKNPIIKRAIDVTRDYCWGQGVMIKARDEEIDAVIQEFMDDSRNQSELTSQTAYSDRDVDLSITGNLFFTLMTAPNGAVQVRSIHANEISSILCNPDDMHEPQFYKREWTRIEWSYTEDQPKMTQMCAYYPDWRYVPTVMPKSIGSAPIMWDKPIYHVKTGIGSMRFGTPDIWSACDWAFAYKDTLSDWTSIIKAYSRIAWQVKANGTKNAMQQAQKQMGTTFNAAKLAENNPQGTGQTFIANKEGVSIEAVKTAGASTNPADAKPLRLMIASTSGIPDNILSGDVDQGSRATATSMDRPLELKMRQRQMMWSRVLQNIFTYVIFKAIKSGRLSGMAEMVNGNFKIDMGDQSPTVDVQFPALIEHDVVASVGAIVQAATLGASGTVAPFMDVKTVARLLLNALHVENSDEIIAKIPDDMTVSAPIQNNPNQPAQEPSPTQAQEAQILQAANLIMEAVKMLDTHVS